MCETTGVINKHFTKEDLKKIGWRKLYNPCYKELLMRTVTTLPYNFIMGIYNPHICYAHKKSTFRKVWELEYEELNATCSHKFRGRNDVNQYLFRYWNLCEGSFYPHYPIGKYITLASSTDSIIKQMRNHNNKVLTINDSVTAGEYDKKVNEILNELKRMYPQKSLYEK